MLLTTLPRLLSPELGREVEAAEVAYFGSFLADAGLSKKEVSVVLSPGSVAGFNYNDHGTHRKLASLSWSANVPRSGRVSSLSVSVDVAVGIIRIA